MHNEVASATTANGNNEYTENAAVLFSPCQVTRGHKFKLCKRQNTHNVRANFFSERVTTCWNSLPDTVDFSSFTSFKRTVKQVISHSFLEFKFVIRPSLLLCVFFQLYCCFTLRSFTAGSCESMLCAWFPVHLYFDFVILLGFERNKWRW